MHLAHKKTVALRAAAYLFKRNLLIA